MRKLIPIIICFLILFVKEANGCDCVTSIGYDEAEIVFVGKVTKIENKGMYEITFRICEVQKGKIKTKKIKVYTPCLMDGCCGIEFKKKQFFKVFAYHNYKRLYTDLCTETTKIEK